MARWTSSVDPNGRVTLPAEIRRRLGVGTNDTVAFVIEDQEIKITAAGPPVAGSYQAIPALNPRQQLSEIIEVAREEHAQHVAREGLSQTRTDR